jgi:hypothetical protein
LSSAASRRLAAGSKLDLPTKFVFAFRNRGGGQVPRDWNFLSWVHLVGATIAFLPQMDYGSTWGKTNSLLSRHVKPIWTPHEPSGTHPIDPLVGGSKQYQGAGKGRLVFGCVLEDAAVLDDFLDLGAGPDSFHTQRWCARIAVYGSRVLVANNLLPSSRKNFKYLQKTRANTTEKGRSVLLFDYSKTCGIDVNKELLTWAGNDGRCPGYFEEGVVVRDNFVYNHGHKGYNVSGNWVTIANNVNKRAFLRQGDDVYGLGGPPWLLTLDGWEVAGRATDNLSRAFDLAGRNLWVDGNRFDNTGSFPGNDGEGIVGRADGGTPVRSWAITHNTHTRGIGLVGFLGGSDVDCHGLLIGWNQTPGWVGNRALRKDTKMTDCAFVANKCDRILPDERTIARLGLHKPLTAGRPSLPTPPTQVTASAYQEDAVKITWTDDTNSGVGYRVERRLGQGKWQVIAYRPPHRQGDPDNPQEWVDFTAPPGKELTYRVVSLNLDDSDKSASQPTTALSLAGPVR